jgi:hypothetical protein
MMTVLIDRRQVKQDINSWSNDFGRNENTSLEIPKFERVNGGVPHAPSTWSAPLGGIFIAALPKEEAR